MAPPPPPPNAVGTHPNNNMTPSLSSDLQSIPRLPAPPVLQEAATLVSSTVNARLHSPQQAHWQQQRQALVTQLTTVAGTAEAAAAAGSQQQQAHRDSHQLLPQQQSNSQQQQQQQDDPLTAPLWQPSYVLANLYADGQQSVGSHSDRLSSLGPLPTIASVSLGAGRVFRLHPANDAVAAAAAAAVAGGSGSSGRLVSSIDIFLPHNSLLVMFPPTQEHWKHEVRTVQQVGVWGRDGHGAESVCILLAQVRKAYHVCSAVAPAVERFLLCSLCSVCIAHLPLPPPTPTHKQVPKTKKGVTPHPLSGQQRINLTFRQLVPAWAAAAPRCRCGRPAIMRCDVKDTSMMVYYWACDNTQGPGCGLYQRAVTLVV